MQFMLRLTLLYICLHFVANYWYYATGQVTKDPVCNREYGWIQDSSKFLLNFPNNWIKLKKICLWRGRGVWGHATLGVLLF